MSWYLDVLKKYAVFSGRAGRPEFWYFTLFSTIIYLALAATSLLSSTLGTILVLLYVLAVFLPSLGVSIRRLHDTNRSGWWYLIAFVPLVGAIVLLVFLVLAGDPQENSYGLPPGAMAADAAYTGTFQPDPGVLLQLHGITKSFGSVEALSDVDFSVKAGEVMALVGDNGAGKSTLIKTIAGIHGPDAGQIFFDGLPVSIHGPKDAARLGIEVVYQDLALADNLDVVENMYLGREVNTWQVLREPEMYKTTEQTLATLRVTTIRSVHQRVATLSGGQRQSVAVARAVMWNSRVVILDEPTAALGVAQTEQVLALVRRLAEQGLAVVIISHNLHDVFEVADRIAVLRLGRNAGLFDRTAVTQEQVVHAITAGQPTKVSGIPGTSAPGAPGNGQGAAT
jgi:D-xylose transport system ATP-binding protein